MRERPIARYEQGFTWTALSGLVAILDASRRKDIAETFTDDTDESSMYRKTYEGVLFTDGTAIVIRTDHGWGGTDVTAGDDAEVEYFLLTPNAIPATPATDGET